MIGRTLFSFKMIDNHILRPFCLLQLKETPVIVPSLSGLTADVLTMLHYTNFHYNARCFEKMCLVSTFYLYLETKTRREKI